MSPTVMDAEARKRTQQAVQAEQAILELVETLVGGWNRHDMTIFSSPFAEDADFVNVCGMWARGRREIADGHGERHRTRFKNSRLRADRISIRFLRPDVAVVQVQWELAGDLGPDGNGLPVRHGVMTLVSSAQGGRWQFDAAQNTDSIVA